MMRLVYTRYEMLVSIPFALIRAGGKLPPADMGLAPTTNTENGRWQMNASSFDAWQKLRA